MSSSTAATSNSTKTNYNNDLTPRRPAEPTVVEVRNSGRRRGWLSSMMLKLPCWSSRNSLSASIHFHAQRVQDVSNRGFPFRLSPRRRLSGGAVPFYGDVTHPIRNSSLLLPFTLTERSRHDQKRHGRLHKARPARERVHSPRTTAREIGSGSHTSERRRLIGYRQ